MVNTILNFHFDYRHPSLRDLFGFHSRTKDKISKVKRACYITVVMCLALTYQTRLCGDVYLLFLNIEWIGFSYHHNCLGCKDLGWSRWSASRDKSVPFNIVSRANILSRSGPYPALGGSCWASAALHTNVVLHPVSLHFSDKMLSFYIYLLCLFRFGPEMPSLKSGSVQCLALDGLMENKAKEARHATAKLTFQGMTSYKTKQTMRILHLSSR